MIPMVLRDKILPKIARWRKAGISFDQISKRLQDKGVAISTSCVHSMWRRHGPTYDASQTSVPRPSIAKNGNGHSQRELDEIARVCEQYAEFLHDLAAYNELMDDPKKRIEITFSIKSN